MKLQLTMFDGFDLPPAEVPDDTLVRLKAAGIRLLGMTWNDHYKYWTYLLRANWDGYGERTLSKTAQGVQRVLAVMEAKRCE